MLDVVYVLVMLGFAGLVVLFAVGCDRLMGPDDRALSEGGRDDTVDG